MTLTRKRRNLKLTPAEQGRKDTTTSNSFESYVRHLLKTSANESELRILLLLRLNTPAGKWSEPISLSDIQQHIGKSRSAVMTAVKRLREIGLLETKKGFGSASVYKILPTSNSADICNNAE